MTGIFNRLVATQDLALSAPCWSSVHPLLATIPVEWDHTFPYGLIYAKVPHAERNARKKRLTINTLSFELHTIFFDEYGDDLPINQRFTADRISHILTMTDFDASDAEQSIKLDGGAMSTLLRWIVHSLEIFMWPEDYVLDPESLSDCFWDVQDEEMDDDFPDEDTALPEPDREASWRVLIEYTDHTTQEIVSYQSHLSDRPEELYLALLEHFEPKMDKFGDDFIEDAQPE